MKLATTQLACVGLVLLGGYSSPASAQAYGIDVFGTVTSSALNFDFLTGTFGDVFDSRGLNTNGYVQGTFINNTASSARGTDVTERGASIIDLPQAADSEISANVQLGSLHGVAGSDASISGSFEAGLTSSFAKLSVGWIDTFTFSSSNRNGSDFTLGLTLNDNLSTSFGPDGLPGSQSFSAATAGASIIVQSSVTNGLVVGPQLFLSESLRQTTDGPSGSSLGPAGRTIEATFHVDGTETVAIAGAMNLLGSVADVTGTGAADASDTAQFFLTTSDADASYSAASGTIYATGPELIAAPVPEPSEWALLAAGLAVIGSVARRRTAPVATEARGTATTALRRVDLDSESRLRVDSAGWPL